MDDLVQEFLIEANENLEIVDVELVKFEAEPSDQATLNNIFRLVHTIKGTCGFLGLPRLEAVAHAGETLLGRFRDGRLAVSAEAVTIVLQSIDRIKYILGELGAHGAEPAGNDADLIAAMETLAEGGVVAEEAAPEPPPRELKPGEVSEAELEAAFLSAVGPDLDVPAASAKAEPPPALPVAAAPPPPPEALRASDEERGDGGAAQSIRVGVDVLEDMMTLVSELVLTRNQLLQVNRRREDGAFSTPLQRLSTITGELQESVMKTRMQPIGAAWKKLPRLVRDLSRELGKKIDLVLDGEGTELDRQVLELIRDPLTHMVRNSADHGLESTADRLAIGKPEAGQIRLSAFHEGGSIVIRISDDGKGLDTARIRAKAVEKGVLGRPEADALSDAQVHRLVFAPGFSTAEAVTNLSGRGVGMDVVRTNIEQIGGQIELSSTPGVGTAFTIKIPLTLAIISALIVGVGGQQFALPQASVLELVRAGEGAEHRIETIESVRLVRLREQLLPLVELAPELNLESRSRDHVFIMIMQVGDRRFGVVVDEVIDTEEIVVKPLAGALRNVPLFSGATILGDGSVVLIIDPNGLTERVGELPQAAETAVSHARLIAATQGGERKSLLIVRAGAGAPKAVELSKITRLEHARADSLERVNGRPTLQYRGRLMPVLSIRPDQVLATEGTQPLLVFTGALFAMGLAVDEIVDVVEDHLNIELCADRPGVMGTAVIAGRATEVLDIDHYIVSAVAEHARTKGASAQDPAQERAAA